MKWWQIGKREADLELELQSGLELGLHLGLRNRAGFAGGRPPFQQLRHATGREIIQPHLDGGTGATGQPGQVFQRVLAAGGPKHHL